MKKELKQCPFCGCKKITDDNVYFYGQEDYSVTCPKCDAMGPFGKTEEQAIKVWNRRAHEQNKN